MPYGCPQYAGGKNIPNIVMFHAVVIAVFVVDYHGIIGVPSLQTQRFILAGYDLREQLLKTPEVFMGGGIPSGLMRGWRFFRWWSQISLICRHDTCCPPATGSGTKASISSAFGIPLISVNTACGRTGSSAVSPAS